MNQETRRKVFEMSGGSMDDLEAQEKERKQRIEEGRKAKQKQMQSMLRPAR